MAKKRIISIIVAIAAIGAAAVTSACAQKDGYLSSVRTVPVQEPPGDFFLILDVNET